MDIKQSGSQPSGKGQAEYFTGTVRIDPLFQSPGGPIQKIRPGDVIWFSAREKHWHGATATTAMTHISIVEQLEGQSADWMEKVSNEQYLAGSSGE